MNRETSAGGHRLPSSVLRPPSSFWCYLLLAGLVLAGAGLRFNELGDKSLWLDEALAWRLTQFPLGVMWERMNNPTEGDNPPLYFLALRGWVAIWGDSEFALRSLAALCGVAAIVGAFVAVGELARWVPAGRIDPVQVGLFAAALVTFSELQIYASRQARMYSLGSALFVWSTWALLRALRPGPGRGPYWAAYCLLALAFGYTHNVAIFSVLGQFLFAAAVVARGAWRVARGNQHGSSRATRHAPRATILTAVAFGIGYLPALLKLMERAGQAGAANAWMGPVELVKVAKETLAALVCMAAGGAIETKGLAMVGLLAAAAVPVALAVRAGGAGWYLLLTLWAPAACMLGYSLQSGISLFQLRYLTFLQTAWLMALALLVFQFRSRWARAAGVVALGLVWPFFVFRSDSAALTFHGQPNMRGAIRFVSDYQGPHEPVVVQSVWCLVKASYYSRHELEQPLLCGRVRSRHAYPESGYLKDDELIAPADLVTMPIDGFWFISSASYEEKAGMEFPLPGLWDLKETRWFDQDYVWEGPIIVRHYVRPRK